MRTGAPWWVCARAWRTEDTAALAIHWINYRQDEDAAIETPIPMGPIRADLLLPDNIEVDRVEWVYSEMKEPLALGHEVVDSRVSFEIPRLIVLGSASSASSRRRGVSWFEDDPFPFEAFEHRVVLR